MREEGKLQSLVFSQSPPSLSVHYTADIYMIHVLIAHSTQFIVLYEAKVHISKQYYSVLTHVIVVPVQPIPCTVQAARPLSLLPSGQRNGQVSTAKWPFEVTLDHSITASSSIHHRSYQPPHHRCYVFYLYCCLRFIFLPIVSSEHSCPQFPVG